MSRRWFPTAILVVLGVILAAITWFGVHIWRLDHGFGQAAGMERLLAYYAVDHGGRMPSAPSELLEKGYCYVGDKGCWIVPRRDNSRYKADYLNPTVTVFHPDHFDVAWGVLPTDVDVTGKVVSRDRLLLLPASASKARYLQPACVYASELIARAMLKQVESPASRPQ
jgi:hypothetical protein